MLLGQTRWRITIPFYSPPLYSLLFSSPSKLPNITLELKSEYLGGVKGESPLDSILIKLEDWHPPLIKLNHCSYRMNFRLDGVESSRFIDFGWMLDNPTSILSTLKSRLRKEKIRHNSKHYLYKKSSIIFIIVVLQM